MNTFIIHFIANDQKGIIAQITSILYQENINILSIEQHVNNKSKKFYIRILADLFSAHLTINQLKNKLDVLNKNLNGKFNFYDPNKKINVGIIGTLESEPIYDLIIKNNSHELNCNIPILISNHNKLQYIADQFKIEYAKINNNKELLNILSSKKIDLIVLARYMQIIPKMIVDKYPNKIINIHHGFLPAFKGAKPYLQAAKKGVKMVGATAHYVNSKLDEGPIIAQDVASINHKHTVKDLIQIGRELERSVLFKAVRAHLEYKIIEYNNKTIVFN